MMNFRLSSMICARTAFRLLFVKASYSSFFTIFLNTCV